MKKPATLAERYETAYFLLMNGKSPAIQTKIRAAKENPDSNDPDVRQFVRDVIEVAEKGQ